MIDESVVYSSPLTNDVYWAKGLSRVYMFSSCFQSLVGRSSHSNSFSTVDSDDLTCSSLSITRKVELHLVGQSFSSFFLQSDMSFSVALVDMFTRLMSARTLFSTDRYELTSSTKSTSTLHFSSGDPVLVVEKSPGNPSHLNRERVPEWRSQMTRRP